MDPISGLSLAANILSVLQITAELISRINDFRSAAQGLPRGLQSLQKELPVLTLSLKRIGSAIKNGSVPDDSIEVLCPIIQDCEEQIKALKGIIEKVLPKKHATTVVRVSKAVTSFRYDGEVKHRGEVIKGYVAMLTLERVVSTPSKDLVVLRTPSTPRFICPFGQDSDFIERPVLADVLSKIGPGSRHALVGGGGIGKSLLAIEYGHRVRKSSPETWVFWVDAENSTKFEQGYREIAKAVQIPEVNENKAGVLSLVCEWLQNEQNGRWVMILDNADDQTVFTSNPPNYQGTGPAKQLRDYLPQSQNGSILVTSRSRDAAFQVTCNYRHITTVEPMSESEARSMLQTRLEGEHSDSDMNLLVETLGYVPLPISQAAANISRRSLPISEYLKELRISNEQSTGLLDENLPELRRDANRSNSIVATWSVTFEYVRKTAPSAARLLSLMCLFDYQNIPESLLQGQYGEEVKILLQKPPRPWWRRRVRLRRTRKRSKFVEASPCDFEADMLMLRDFSLIKFNNDRRYFSMHPLVQFITIKWLVHNEELDAWSQKFISILNISFPNPEGGHFEECEPLLAHAYAAIPYRPSDTSTQALRHWAFLTTKVANCFYQKYSLITAGKMYRVASEAFTITSGPSDHNALETSTRQAIILSFMDLKPEAEKIHRRVLALKNVALGLEHPSTLDTIDHLGDVLLSLKRTAEAELLHVQTLHIRIRNLGPNHRKTQNSFSKRGSFLLAQGRYMEAHAIWKQAYEARRAGGEDHYDASWCTNLEMIGVQLQLQGRPAEAEIYLRESFSEKERTLQLPDSGHWLIYSTATSLARTLYELGKYDEAESLFRRSLLWYSTNNGIASLETLQAMSALTSVLCKKNELVEAEALGRECLINQTELLGPNHRETLESVWILGGVMEKQGRNKAARNLFKQAYEGSRGSEGENHEDTEDYLRDWNRLKEIVEVNENAASRDSKLDCSSSDVKIRGEIIALKTELIIEKRVGRFEAIGVDFSRGTFDNLPALCSVY